MSTLDEEALVVAMVVAPGVYSRNRMFDLFASPVLKRARKRAATLRGVVPQLGRASGVSVTTEKGRGLSGEAMFVLRYQIPTLRLSRLLELTEAELAALKLVAARANVNALPLDETDRHVVEGALARLLGAGETGVAFARAASAVPPP